MDERPYRFLKWVAVGLGLFTLAWAIWDSFPAMTDPEIRRLTDAATAFEDGAYERALEAYRDAAEADPDTVYAYRGIALSLTELGRHEEALATFETVIAMEPEFAGNYANRGVLLDRMGHYERAVADYARALDLDPELGEGPHWLTRFLRNQPDTAPTIVTRLGYLRQELAKPEAERLLRMPELDAEQRPYRR